MKNIVNSAPQGLITLDKEGKIIDINYFVLRTLNYSRKEVLGKHIGFLLTTVGKTFFNLLFSLPNQINGSVDEVPLTFRKRDGSDIPFILYGRLTDQGQVECVAEKGTKRYDYENELLGIQKILEKQMYP